jgi:hypothetical protein
MKSSLKIIVALCICILLTPSFLWSQNNTSSPYSKFGTGELASVGYGRNLALGGSGYGLRDQYQLNIKNPASITSIDSMNFLFEIGVNGQYTSSSSTDKNQIFWSGNLTHLVFGHRYTNWLMGTYGVMPFSSVGYNLRTFQTVESDESYVFTDWVGTGGLNKVFYLLGLKISKNFSLGGEVSYLNGSLVESRKTWAVVETNNPTYYLSNSRYSGITYKGAFQFTANLDKKGTSITIGGIFSPLQKLRGKSNVIIDQQYGTNYVDSMYYHSGPATPINLPLTFGAGLGFRWKGKYLLAADYERANWSVNADKSYVDQHIYSFGLEKVPQNSLKYFDRCSYRVGFRYDSGYIRTKGYTIDDKRISIGVGFPVQRTASMLNFTLEAGQKGTIHMGLIQEKYIKMTVAFSLQDYWFIKRKLN